MRLGGALTWLRRRSSDLWESSSAPLTTSVLTIYRERLATRREITIRDQQYERDRKASRDAFRRESILALQSAVFDVIKAVYDELDRMLTEVRETGQWPARQWETPRPLVGRQPC
jgi:hypothetical protein